MSIDVDRHLEYLEELQKQTEIEREIQSYLVIANSHGQIITPKIEINMRNVVLEEYKQKESLSPQ